MTAIFQNTSAILLAGGYSSRMGTDKAELLWNGMRLIEYQAARLKALGIGEVLISGYAKSVEGTRFVPDIYPHRGPLSGIHAGLLASANPRSLVLSVDTPLVPGETLAALTELHLLGTSPITVLSHGGELEPLIGVYDSVLSASAEQILQGSRSSVRLLFEYGGYARFEYAGDERLLHGCNTPQEFEALQELSRNKNSAVF